MQNLCLGFWKLGIFENWVGLLFFVKIFSISWLGVVPFVVCVSVLALCGNLNLYWGMFHRVHAFFIVIINCCMLGVWQNVQVTFFGCIGLKWVPLLEFTLIEIVSHALDVFNSLCSQMPCLVHIVHTLGISRHTSCTSSCTHKHHQMHSLCTYKHTHLFHALWVWLHGLTSLACCFVFIYSVFELFRYVLGCFTFKLN